MEKKVLTPEEKEENQIKRKREANIMREQVMSIEAVYSDQVKSAVREHLINSDIEMPMYSQALYSIFVSSIIDIDDMKLLPHILPNYTTTTTTTTGNHDIPAADAAVDALAVSTQIINEIEQQYRMKLNDSSFTLPDDLKILWSIRDGFSSPKFDFYRSCYAEDQHLLPTHPFPSVKLIRGPLSSDDGFALLALNV